MSPGCVRTSVSRVARNNETAPHEKDVCFESSVGEKKKKKEKKKKSESLNVFV